MTKTMKSFVGLIVLSLFIVVTVACGGGSDTPTAENALSGVVQIDGSSTVFPIQEAVAEEYRSVQPDVRVTVGVSGTGGGFKKFINNETDMNNASRHISENELEIAQSNGIEVIELPIAFDGLSVIVSKDNDFVTDLTVEELHKIWTGQYTNWNEVRSVFPDATINLYGPGTDSGTFDYWVEVIIGKGNAITSRFTASEDDNLIVKGVSEDKFGLSYFGFAYYIENQDKLNLVAVAPEAGATPILPTEETINNGTYAPLSRPIFVYLNADSFRNKPQVEDFVYFMNTHAGELALEVGYINMPQTLYDENKDKLDALLNQ
jgi:phosphate transport system substrate-binding protein